VVEFSDDPEFLSGELLLVVALVATGLRDVAPLADVSPPPIADVSSRHVHVDDVQPASKNENVLYLDGDVWYPYLDQDLD